MNWFWLLPTAIWMAVAVVWWRVGKMERRRADMYRDLLALSEKKRLGR